MRRPRRSMQVTSSSSDTGPATSTSSTVGPRPTARSSTRSRRWLLLRQTTSRLTASRGERRRSMTFRGPGGARDLPHAEEGRAE
eukprot:27362-Eustigmatos_ZCMA.PRE.1